MNPDDVAYYAMTSMEHYCHVIDADTHETLHSTHVRVPHGIARADEADEALAFYLRKETDIWGRPVALIFPYRPWLNVS